MVVVSVLVVVVAATHTPVATVEVASSRLRRRQQRSMPFEGLQQVCLVWERGGSSVFRFS